jgi:hypothetical protein
MVDEQKSGREHGRKHRKLWIALLVAVAIAAGLTVDIVRFITAEATITHDYTPEYNALTRPTGFDPNGNAAPLYNKAFAQLTEPPTGWPTPASFEPKQDTTGAQRRFLEPWVTANAPALEIIAQAVEKPFCWVECTSLTPAEAINNFQACRFAVLCLCYRARLQAADGHPAEAFQSITTAYRMTRQLSRDGTESSTLVAMALDAMSRATAYALIAEGTMPSDVLSNLQQYLESTQSAGISSRVALMAGTDRVRWLNAIQAYFTDNGRGGGHIVFKRLLDDARQTTPLTNQMDEAALYFKTLWTASRHPGREQTIRSMDDHLETASRLAMSTPWQLREKGESSEVLQQGIVGNYVLQARTGAFPRLIELCWRSSASESAFLAILAISRYKQDKGTLPDNLGQLVERGYLHEVPMDPYSAGPLVYKASGTTFTIYSVGADFDDDGGKPDDRRGAYDGDEVFWPMR